MSKFKPLVTFVTKIFIIIFAMFLITIDVDAQKRRKSNVRPTVIVTPKKQKQSRGIVAVVRPLKVEPPQTFFHKDLHPPNEPNWWDGVEVKLIFLSGRIGASRGFLEYYASKEDFKTGIISNDIEWDQNTLFFGLPNQKKFYPNGCFVLMYCTKHKMAYLLEQFECSKWEDKP